MVLAILLAAVVPLRIVPDKIVYAVGETGTVEVVVEGRGETPLPRAETVVVEEKWGLEGEGRELWRGTVSLTNGERKTLAIPYPGSTVRYGHEVRVTAHPVIPSSHHPLIPSSCSRSEFFAVNTDWWRVAQGCGLDTLSEKPTPLYRQFMEYYGLPVGGTKCTAGDRLWMDACRHEGFGMGPFPGYWTLLTRWQMQMSSVGGNKSAADMPDGETWYTITECTEARDSGRIREDARVSHAHGVHHTRYTIGNLEGPCGFELARKRPEGILRTDRGQFAGTYHSSRTAPEEIADLKFSGQTAWTYLKPNFHRDDVVEWALRDLADAIDGFGEDGVYWDGRYAPGVGYDAEGTKLPDAKDPRTRARREKTRDRWRELILEGHPNRFAWWNEGVQETVRRQPGADHPRVGSLIEVQWPFLLNPSMSCSTYRGFLDYILPARNARYLPYPDGTRPSKTYFVGYLYPNFSAGRRENPGQYRESWTMAQHVMSILASALAHPLAGGPQFRNFKQMMMRYSELFWHEDIEVMRDGYKRFVADSLREIWYDDMIYRREAADHTDYYIHLVNVPESERCREDVEVDPPEADDVEVSTKLFGVDGVKAWAIRPYGYLDPVLEPRQQEVPVRRVKGETVFAVPPFRYYTLLVIRVARQA